MLISTAILHLPCLARAERVNERKAIASGNREKVIFRPRRGPLLADGVSFILKISYKTLGGSSVYNFKLIHVQITFGACSAYMCHVKHVWFHC